MKKLLMAGLICLTMTGCFNNVVEKEEEKIFTKKVVIINDCYYYIASVNLTVYDVTLKDKDINNNNLLSVTYKECGSYVAIMKVEDDE